MRVLSIISGWRRLTVILTLTAIAGSAIGHGAGTVEFTYGQGGALSGDVAGTLDVVRIQWPGGPPDQVVVEDATVRLRVIETVVNYTVVGSSAVEDPFLAVTQEDRWVTLPAGDVLVTWPYHDAYALLKADPHGFWADSPETMDVDLHLASANWGAASFGVSGPPYWQPAPNGAGEVSGGVPAWHKNVDVSEGGVVELDGPFVLHLRGAKVGAGDIVYELGSYIRIEDHFGTDVPGAARRAKVMTDGFLEVSAGRTDLPSSGSSISVVSAEWMVDGDALFHDASGTFEVGSQHGAIRNETVGVAGRFALIESVDERDDRVVGKSTTVDAHATGDLSIVAIDYMVTAAAPSGPSLLEQAIWVTMLFGMLGLLAWAVQHGFVALYSRIREDAVLEHPKRAEIMQFVEENPGCHVLRVAEDLGLARGVARHHLMVLERAGRLRRFRESGQTLLVPAYQTKDDALRAAASEDPHLSAIRSLVAQGGMRRAELVAVLRNRFGVADPTARRWIEKAVKVGLIEEFGRGHGVTYRHGS